jgi:hypothetical protein
MAETAFSKGRICHVASCRSTRHDFSLATPCTFPPRGEDPLEGTCDIEFGDDFVKGRFKATYCEFMELVFRSPEHGRIPPATSSFLGAE